MPPTRGRLADLPRRLEHVHAVLGPQLGDGGASTVGIGLVPPPIRYLRAAMTSSDPTDLGAALRAQRAAARRGVRARLRADEPRGSDGAATALTAAPVSVPRLLLHLDGMAPRIVNLDVWGWHVVSALRREASRSPSQPLEALIAELEALLPDRPRAPAPDYVGVAVPRRMAGDELRLLTTLTHFGTAVDVALAELRLEAFLPADETTAAALVDLDDAAGARGVEPTSS